MGKRALVVGINYPGSSAPLNGCINDAQNVTDWLERRGYIVELIVDDSSEGRQRPTRATILERLLALILSGDDELYFHYSGHGSQVRDTSGDEKDGKDETLVPCDYETNGMITDDELRGLLTCVTNKQRLIMVLDCCHSGTGIDVCWNLYQRYTGGDFFLFKDKNYTETRGEVVCLSGCLDRQTSADAYIGGSYQGALTVNLLRIWRQGISWRQLVEGVRAGLRDGGYTQIPNLTSGRWLNLESTARV